MKGSLDDLVRRRAGDRCEYCLLPQVASDLLLPIDHIVARQHGGATEAGNLALSCAQCNAHKGPNIAGISPEDGSVVPLFHPRRQVWAEHFEWRGAEIVGRTVVGWVTIHVLAMNGPVPLAIRTALIEEGDPPR